MPEMPDAAAASGASVAPAPGDAVAVPAVPSSVPLPASIPIPGAPPKAAAPAAASGTLNALENAFENSVAEKKKEEKPALADPAAPAAATSAPAAPSVNGEVKSAQDKSEQAKSEQEIQALLKGEGGSAASPGAPVATPQPPASGAAVPPAALPQPSSAQPSSAQPGAVAVPFYPLLGAGTQPVQNKISDDDEEIPAVAAGGKKTASGMTQQERDREINTMLSGLKGGEKAPVTPIKEVEPVRPPRIPGFLYEKERSEDNAHLPRIYSGSEMSALLVHAAETGDLNGVDALLHSGQDVNKPASDGITPLIAAARAGQKNTVQYLLANGADPDIADKEGKTPLIAAAGAGALDAMQQLMDRGANPDAHDAKGNTALHNAAAAGKNDAARLLFLRGADPRIATPAGVTPSALARQQGNTELAAKLDEAALHYVPGIAQTRVAGEGAVSGKHGIAQTAAARKSSSKAAGRGTARDVAVVFGKKPGAGVDGDMKDGRWYMDETGPRRVWFKYKGPRPVHGEHPETREEWMYSQNKEGKWYVVDNIHVSYATMQREEQKRWNLMLEGWMKANDAFYNLESSSQRQWNEKRKLLEIVFEDHFIAKNAQEQAQLDDILLKWRKLDDASLGDTARAKPESSSTEDGASEQQIAERASSATDAEPLSAAPTGGDVVPPLFLHSQQGSAAVAMPFSPAGRLPTLDQQVRRGGAMPPVSLPVVEARGAHEREAAETKTPVIVWGQDASAGIAFPQSMPRATVAPEVAELTVLLRNGGQKSAPTPQEGTAQSDSPEVRKLKEMLASAGRAETLAPEADRQLRVINMLGAWEKVDQKFEQFSPADKADAEVQRRKLLGIVSPAGEYGKVFAGMPELMRKDFATSMQRWSAYVARVAQPVLVRVGVDSSGKAGKKTAAPAVKPAAPKQKQPRRKNVSPAPAATKAEHELDMLEQDMKPAPKPAKVKKVKPTAAKAKPAAHKPHKKAKPAAAPEVARKQSGKKAGHPVLHPVMRPETVVPQETSAPSPVQLLFKPALKGFGITQKTATPRQDSGTENH